MYCIVLFCLLSCTNYNDSQDITIQLPSLINTSVKLKAKHYISKTYADCMDEDVYCDCIENIDFPLIYVTKGSLPAIYFFDTRSATHEYNRVVLEKKELNSFELYADDSKLNYLGLIKFNEDELIYQDENNKTIDYKILSCFDDLLYQDVEKEFRIRKTESYFLNKYDFSIRELVKQSYFSVDCFSKIENTLIIYSKKNWLIMELNNEMKLFSYKQSEVMSIEPVEKIDTTFILKATPPASPRITN